MGYSMKPQVAVIMGSTSDWETMKNACDVLEQFGVPYIKGCFCSSTPDYMFSFAEGKGRRIKRSSPEREALPICREWSPPKPIAGHWCPGSIQSVEWIGFVIIHCTNAGRSSRCHSGDWCQWSKKCRIISRSNIIRFR